MKPFLFHLYFSLVKSWQGVHFMPMARTRRTKKRTFFFCRIRAVAWLWCTWCLYFLLTCFTDKISDGIECHKIIVMKWFSVAIILYEWVSSLRICPVLLFILDSILEFSVIIFVSFHVRRISSFSLLLFIVACSRVVIIPTKYKFSFNNFFLTAITTSTYFTRIEPMCFVKHIIVIIYADYTWRTHENYVVHGFLPSWIQCSKSFVYAFITPSFRYYSHSI